MKKQTLLFLAFIATLSISAQTGKIKSIMLKTGVQITFNETYTDSARVIFTPSGDSLGIKVYTQDKGCRDYLYSQISYTLWWGDSIYNVTDTANINRNNARDLARNAESWRLEFPRLYQGTNTTFEVTHSTADYGITYSLEWDGDLKANRWTCYQFYAGNRAKNVSRTDAFQQDPDIPSAYQATLSDYSNSGYSRGHLCPSGDRLCSKEQNMQTFYLSNMQPQEQGHNGGVWNDLEAKVRDTWAAGCDTLYVVKAATIDSADYIKTYTSSGLIVPKYFYMALLSYTKSTNTYRAMGVWSLHQSDSTTEYITIDELERRTGIDFFCNLYDVIETKIEQTLDTSYWGVSN